MRKILSFLLVLTCLLGTMPCVSMAEDDVEPSFKVIGSTIEGDDSYFELTMQVTPGKRGFFSAGMVLEYDKSVMRPASWGENAVVLPMRGCTDWHNVASLPVVCPKDISGKTVFAYEEAAMEEPTATPGTEATSVPVTTPGAETTDAPDVTAEPTATPDIAARRAKKSRNADDNPETTPEVSPSAAPEVSVSPDATPNASEEPAISPTPAVSDGGSGYLYISSESALPVKELPNEGRVLTVRFKYAGETKEEMAASKQRIIEKFVNANDLNKPKSDMIVSMAPLNIAKASPAGHMLFCAAGDDKETEYYYDGAGKNDDVEHHIFMQTQPEFVLEQDVQSADTGGGGADPSQFAALVFFDWDESTLLGSMVVNGAAAQEDIIAQTNSFALGLMAPNAEGDLPAMGTTWADTDAKNWVVYNNEQEDGKAKYPLSSHEGYTFGEWIEFDSEDFTVYGESVDALDATLKSNDPVPAPPTYQDISDGLVLKAAYTANSSMTFEDLATIDARRYTFSIDEDPNSGYFGRYGSSNNYRASVKVTRVNGDNKPIFRPRQTALIVTYTINSSIQILSLVTLANVDNQVTEVAVPLDADSVSFTVIDIGGVANWASGSAARSESYSIAKEKYKFNGDIIYLNEYAESGNTTALARSYFDQVGLTLPSTSATARRKAITDIALGQTQKLENTGKKYLTKDEMQNAISNNGNYLGSGV